MYKREGVILSPIKGLVVMCAVTKDLSFLATAKVSCTIFLVPDTLHWDEACPLMSPVTEWLILRFATAATAAPIVLLPFLHVYWIWPSLGNHWLFLLLLKGMVLIIRCTRLSIAIPHINVDQKILNN